MTKPSSSAGFDIQETHIVTQVGTTDSAIHYEVFSATLAVDLIIRFTIQKANKICRKDSIIRGYTGPCAYNR